MNWNPPIEQDIRDAVQSGAWDDPAMHGKKLDLSAYFATPVALRMGYSILQRGGYVPLEVELRRQIHALEKRESLESRDDVLAVLRRERQELEIRLEMEKRS